jgi:hypothetical protein
MSVRAVSSAWAWGWVGGLAMVSARVGTFSNASANGLGRAAVCGAGAHEWRESQDKRRRLSGGGGESRRLFAKSLGRSSRANPAQEEVVGVGRWAARALPQASESSARKNASVVGQLELFPPLTTTSLSSWRSLAALACRSLAARLAHLVVLSDLCPPVNLLGLGGGGPLVERVHHGGPGGLRHLHPVR